MSHLLKCSTYRNFRPSELIIHQGDAPKGVWIIVKGQVKVWRADAVGNVDVLAFRGRRDVIGRTALLGERLRSANVEASERSTVALVPSGTYLELMERHGLGDRVLGDISDRLAESLIVRGGSNPSARLAFLLTRVLDRRGTAEGTRKAGPVVLRSTHEDLGRHLGMPRNAISRMLGELGDAGVRTRRGQIEIVDNEKLRALARIVQV
ncbi:Crp/Fnr family transcriptional regulator [Actinomadura sp. WMMB 499]|uniref:Crp/Fnr family transcriptional regulator n=1 Tax=Actinomadura sp. WMMB 499 TaxID=1219491 RepID=UPI00159E95E6|nr:Crp/Fnr family transcriptional regulator [Actinomadura sp. WMMB 499]